MSFPQYYKLLASPLSPRTKNHNNTPPYRASQAMPPRRISEMPTRKNASLTYSLREEIYAHVSSLIALRTHPDRLPKNSTEAQKRAATEKFQAVADAYYVLSDPKRRKEYDDLYRSQRPSGGFSSSSTGPSGGAGSGFPGGAFAGGFASGAADDEEYDESSQHEASGNFFRTFASMFGGGGKQSSEKTEEDPLHGGRPDANGVFGDVFEDMLAPEVANVRPFWSYVGGAAGGAIGYIVGNIPGAAAGALAGNRLGAVRDAKGKSVAQVFSGLGASQKAEILRALAFKVLGSMS